MDPADSDYEWSSISGRTGPVQAADSDSEPSCPKPGSRFRWTVDGWALVAGDPAAHRRPRSLGRSRDLQDGPDRPGPVRGPQASDLSTVGP